MDPARPRTAAQRPPGTGRRVLLAMRLALRVQTRSRFPHIYLGVAATTVVVFRLLPLGGLAGLWVPAFLLGEPGTLGVYLVAAQRFLERTEGSDQALAVTPLRRGEAVAGLALSTAVPGTAAGALVFAGTVGVDARLLALLPVVFATVTLSALLGTALAERFDEFTRFLLGSVGPVALYSLPFARHFGLLPAEATAWVPSDPALRAFAGLCRADPDPARIAACAGLLLAWNAAGFAWLARRRRSVTEPQAAGAA